MKRIDAIFKLFRDMGAQHVGNAGDMIVTDQFTDYIFRGIQPSVYVREWEHGAVEVIFVEELHAGTNRTEFHKTPEMEWVLQTIKDRVKPYPKVPA
jgi:hypothetical protein